MQLINDVSLAGLVSTAVISGTIAFVGWGAKKLIVELVTYLVRTIAKVELLNERLTQMIEIVDGVPKLKSDLNRLYSRIKDLEEKSES